MNISHAALVHSYYTAFLQHFFPGKIELLMLKFGDRLEEEKLRVATSLMSRRRRVFAGFLIA
jgi:hypothetical protein